MSYTYPVTSVPASFRRVRLCRFKGMEDCKVAPARRHLEAAEQGLLFPSRKTAPTNILFQYLYRDASNHKQHGEIVFSNRTFLPLDEIEKQIRASLHDGQFFIAHQIHIESRFFVALHEDDHPWHEFEGVEVTAQPPFDPENQAQKEYRRDITEFIADLEWAHKTGWNVDIGSNLTSQSKSK